MYRQVDGGTSMHADVLSSFKLLFNETIDDEDEAWRKITTAQLFSSAATTSGDYRTFARDVWLSIQEIGITNQQQIGNHTIHRMASPTSNILSISDLSYSSYLLDEMSEPR